MQNKGVLVFLLTILLISTISSIRINEVESNPPANDKGSEWVELYSKDDIDIERFVLMNADGEKIFLSGNFQGYYIYVFEKQWLDNTNEKVYLYEGEGLIDETGNLSDSANNDKTWQYCNGWEFNEQTKKRDNGCEEEVIDESQDEKEVAAEKKQEVVNKKFINKNGKVVKTFFQNNESLAGQETSEIQDVDQPKVIKLSAKTIKSTENSKDKGPSDYAFYGLIGFAALLGVLFLLRRRKYNNEFRED